VEVPRTWVAASGHPTPSFSWFPESTMPTIESTFALGEKLLAAQTQEHQHAARYRADPSRQTRAAWFEAIRALDGVAQEYLNTVSPD